MKDLRIAACHLKENHPKLLKGALEQTTASSSEGVWFTHIQACWKISAYKANSPEVTKFWAQIQRVDCRAIEKGIV